MVLPHVGLEGIIRVLAALPLLALEQVGLVLEDQAGVGQLLLEVEVHARVGLLVYSHSAV